MPEHSVSMIILQTRSLKVSKSRTNAPPSLFCSVLSLSRRPLASHTFWSVQHMAVRMTVCMCVCVLKGAGRTAVGLSHKLPVINKEVCSEIRRPQIEHRAGVGGLFLSFMFSACLCVCACVSVCVYVKSPSLSPAYVCQHYILRLTQHPTNFLCIFPSHTYKQIRSHVCAS